MRGDEHLNFNKVERYLYLRYADRVMKLRIRLVEHVARMRENKKKYITFI
jgi:hypothetical protein